MEYQVLDKEKDRMARKKKNDFWDDVEDLNTVSDDDQTGDDDTAEVAVDEEWSAVKSLPLKVIMRFLLMVSCLVALVSAYIAYEYVNDRYAGGSYSTDSLTVQVLQMNITRVWISFCNWYRQWRQILL